jgi:hypothetical protein
VWSPCKWQECNSDGGTITCVTLNTRNLKRIPDSLLLCVSSHHSRECLTLHTPHITLPTPKTVQVSTPCWSDRTCMDSNLKPKHWPLDHRCDFQNSCSGNPCILTLWHIACNTDVYYTTDTCKFVWFGKAVHQYTFEMSNVGQLCLLCELYMYLASCRTIVHCVHAMEYSMKLNFHQVPNLLWYKWTEVWAIHVLWIFYTLLFICRVIAMNFRLNWANANTKL